MTGPQRVAVVAPVYHNADTLVALADRLGAALSGREWRLRLVIDACPDGSGEVADGLAARRPEVAVTHLTVNGGQHAALCRGLADEPDADLWVCLDADLQDPPEAVPTLLAALSTAEVATVFAGRRGNYESRWRRLTGNGHRRVLAALTGLPADAGAFVALDARARAAVLDRAAPSIVAAIGASRLPVASVPVVRAVRPSGSSAWTGRARLRQSVESLAWAAAQRTHRSTTSGVNSAANGNS